VGRRIPNQLCPHLMPLQTRKTTHRKRSCQRKGCSRSSVLIDRVSDRLCAPQAAYHLDADIQLSSVSKRASLLTCTRNPAHLTPLLNKQQPAALLLSSRSRQPPDSSLVSVPPQPPLQDMLTSPSCDRAAQPTPSSSRSARTRSADA
jgi:hypothetical protein